MFRSDSGGRTTARFGGLEFVPASVSVRSYGEKGQHIASALENTAKYNDFVPLIYGTAWYSPLTVFSRNDGNLTHLEVLLGMGEMQSVLKVVVNGVEIPAARRGADMTATGWFEVITLGGRNGAFNQDFTDPSGLPAGDPYGSMAAMSVVVPNRINDGRSLPRIEVLAEGIKLDMYDANGAWAREAFSSNPAWIILDVLRRSGWKLEDIDLASFARAASYCDEAIEAIDLHGNPIQIPRFQCNLPVTKRRSAGDLIRGIRNSSRLSLTYGAGGLLQLRVENRLGLQHPVRSEFTNSDSTLNGGWPAYEFGDGTDGFSGILRLENGTPSVRMWSRSTSESPNRITTEFQDALNGYQQDSLSLVDVEDVLKTGQEISTALTALGLPNMNQATRAVKLALDKSISGNTYIEFETSVRALGLAPGDLVTVTYLKEGLRRQVFRIIRIAPSQNFRTASITAQIHDDAWYEDTGGSGLGELTSTRTEQNRFPRPLAGTVLDEYGCVQFGVSERPVAGDAALTLAVDFRAPQAVPLGSPAAPLVDIAPEVLTEGGAIRGDQVLYYAFSACDASGREGPLSFVATARIAPGSNSSAVRFSKLGFPKNTASFRVYRGTNTSELIRIASKEMPGSVFTDSGLSYEFELPPDEAYHHANFYWRSEVVPEHAATLYSSTTIGNNTLVLKENEHRGMVVRITRGTGSGQERLVASNSASEVVTASPWTVVPDSTSHFVIAEAAWRFGARVDGSPAIFDVPLRPGATLQISGRSANVHDEECAAELSPVTRWRLAADGSAIDQNVPPAPHFGLTASGDGSVQALGISFDDLSNTRGITAGVLTLNYWDELSFPPPARIAEDIDASQTELILTDSVALGAGALIQIDGEIFRVNAAADGGLRCTVERGVHETIAEAHRAGNAVYPLKQAISVLPFVPDFFGSPASGSYKFRIALADARIASGEMTVKNNKGHSPIRIVSFTSTSDSGLRTLSGGQFALQVDGALSIQDHATPPLIVQSTHSIRDIFAVVGRPPVGGAIEVRVTAGEAEMCRLRIEAGETVSNVINGFGLGPLESGLNLGLDIISVPQGTGTAPGRDLTVCIRR